MNDISTIIIFIGLMFLLCCFSRLKKNNTKPLKVDNLLVQNYQQKQNYIKKVVLVIESFTNVEHLLNLLRNILLQEIKVDYIILISQDVTLNNIRLIQNTCILNKIGGLSLLLKESSNDTIIVFIFSEGFNSFKNPKFLKHFLKTKNNINGIVKIETSSVNVGVDKIYQ